MDCLRWRSEDVVICAVYRDAKDYLQCGKKIPSGHHPGSMRRSQHVVHVTIIYIIFNDDTRATPGTSIFFGLEIISIISVSQIGKAVY